MKKCICFMLIICILFVLVGCGQNNNYQSNKYNDDDNNKISEQGEVSSPSIDTKLSIDDVTVNYIYVDSNKIYLPCFFRDFTAYGWSLIYDSDIAAGYVCNYGNSQPDGNVLRYNNKSYETIGSIALHNKSDEISEVEACIVSHVVLNAQKGTFLLPGNITEKSTRKDIINAFGDNDNNEYYSVVEIEKDSISYGRPYNNKMLRYDFYFDGDTLDWVKVLNVTDKENFS